MAGHIGPIDTYVPISDFFSFVEGHAGMAGASYRAFVRTVDLSGDAGVAVLVETDWWGCDFVDYFSVARIDGRWQITNKNLPTPGANRPLSDRPRAAQGRSPARCHNAVG